MGKRKKFFRAVAEGIVALSVAFNFVSCGKKTKTEATVLSLGISADDEAAEADMGNIVPFENIRVLLAEDNELNSEIASVLLRENGIEVECAANGKQACDMFFAHKEHYYDLILMDVMMPVMDGIAATKAIRSFDHPLAKTIPIVAMTANAFEDDVRKMREAGMNEHLSKPIRITEVLKTIRWGLKTSGGGGRIIRNSSDEKAAP